MQTLFGSLLLPPQSCCLQPSWHPFSLPSSAPNGIEGNGWCYFWTGPCKKGEGEKVVKVRKRSLRSIDRTRVSSMYPSYKPSSSVQRSKTVWCFGAYLVYAFLAHRVKCTVKWICCCSFSVAFGWWSLLKICCVAGCFNKVIHVLNIWPQQWDFITWKAETSSFQRGQPSVHMSINSSFEVCVPSLGV